MFIYKSQGNELAIDFDGIVNRFFFAFFTHCVPPVTHRAARFFLTDKT